MGAGKTSRSVDRYFTREMQELGPYSASSSTFLAKIKGTVDQIMVRAVWLGNGRFSRELNLGCLQQFGRAIFSCKTKMPLEPGKLKA